MIHYILTGYCQLENIVAVRTDDHRIVTPLSNYIITTLFNTRYVKVIILNLKNNPKCYSFVV